MDQNEDKMDQNKGKNEGKSAKNDQKLITPVDSKIDFWRDNSNCSIYSIKQFYNNRSQFL